VTETRAAVEPAQPAAGSRRYVADRSWRRTRSCPATHRPPMPTNTAIAHAATATRMNPALVNPWAGRPVGPMRQGSRREDDHRTYHRHDDEWGNASKAQRAISRQLRRLSHRQRSGRM
jgi:hypothetical protein